MTASSLQHCQTLRNLTLSAMLGLSGCAAINIQDIETDKLDIRVELQQKAQITQVDVFLSRGVWSQPVRMNDALIAVTYADGSSEALVAANKSGRYGLRKRDSSPITGLRVDPIGTQIIPLMTPVRIAEGNEFEGQTFFKDDILTLNLTESAGTERYLVASGRCGSNVYSSEQKITDRATSKAVRLGDLMTRVNNAAEADLNGIIPITLTLEERYLPNWTPPFKVGTLSASDSVQFQIDTSGFRFRTAVTVLLGNNMRMQVQNQAWDVRYCYQLK